MLIAVESQLKGEYLGRRHVSFLTATFFEAHHCSVPNSAEELDKGAVVGGRGWGIHYKFNCRSPHVINK